jgi:hypothetical protein
MSPEEGEIHCEYAGHCKDIAIVLRVFFPFYYEMNTMVSLKLLSDVLEFDNSFSYFRSKKIWYSITMESSKGVCENGN